MKRPRKPCSIFRAALSDFPRRRAGRPPNRGPRRLVGRGGIPEGAGRVEWAASWVERGDGFLNTYANTIPTPQGGTHEAGFRAALVKGLARLLVSSRRKSAPPPM
jgi:topoisomerase-4 subunit B